VKKESRPERKNAKNSLRKQQHEITLSEITLEQRLSGLSLGEERRKKKN